MLYCSTPVVKVSDTMLTKIKSVQYRVHNVIYGLQTDKICSLISINNQKMIKVAMQMFKCRQGTCIPGLRKHADNIDHQHETRSNTSLLRLPLIKTEAAKRSLYFQGPYCFNELPKNKRSLESIAIFKSKLREHFYRKRNL